MDTAKNDALNIAIKLEMNMNEEIIKESFEEINIRHLIDEEENEEEEENNDDIIEQQNEDIVSASEDFGNFEDLENLPNDILIFKNQTELNLRDYTTNCTESNKGLFLDVNVNGKKYVVRKSSLCWLYQIKIDCLMTDYIEFVV